MQKQAYDFPEGFVEDLQKLVNEYKLQYIDYLGIIAVLANTLIKELIARYESLPNVATTPCGVDIHNVECEEPDNLPF